ncbi:hypothetical protein IMF23_03380 [Chelatococcus daeguensis]|uniref:hypothetical protein n=1 Tax=Chelatococcus daeguensis TaxID=444444 RepID=UPI0012FC3F5B|nr:hypothetical protein [Chelatococcus daeguensis]MBM3082473.1 hypothetical protein [Chelatococcus daeguensis]
MEVDAAEPAAIFLEDEPAERDRDAVSDDRHTVQEIDGQESAVAEGTYEFPPDKEVGPLRPVLSGSKEENPEGMRQIEACGVDFCRTGQDETVQIRGKSVSARLLANAMCQPGNNLLHLKIPP